MDNEVKVKVTANTQGVQQGMKQAASSVSHAAQSMKATHGDLSTSTGSVFSRLKSNISAFASHHKEEFSHMGHDVSTFKGAFVGAFAGAAIGGAILEFGEKIGEAVRHVAEMGDQMLKTSQKVGVGVEQLSKLKYAAELSDVSFGQLTKGMERFARNVSTVGSQSNDASRALQQLGIESKDAEGKTKDMTTLMGEVADQFKEAEDGTNKTAIAMALFGKAGADMIPFLNKGSDGIKEMGDEAERLGIVFDQDTAEASETLNDEIKRMNAAFTGITQQLVSQFVPILANMAHALLESAKQGGALHTIFQSVGFTAKVLVSAFETVMLAARSFGTFVTTIFHQITSGVTSFVSAVTKLMKGDFTGAFAEAKAGLGSFDKSAEVMFRNVQKDAEETALQVKKLWGIVKDPPKPHEEHGKKKSMGSLGDAQESEKEAKAKLKAEEKAAKEEERIRATVARENAAIEERLEKEHERQLRLAVKATEKAQKEENQIRATMARENGLIDERLQKAREKQLAAAVKATEKAQHEEEQIRATVSRENLQIEGRLEKAHEKALADEVKSTEKAVREEQQIRATMARENAQIEARLEKEHEKQLAAEVKATEKAAKEQMQIASTVGRENARIEQKLQKDHEQAFKDMVKPVSQAFGQMTIGVLRGNQTIADATRKMGADIAVSYGNMAAQALLHWIESQVEMTAVQELEGAKRLALQAAGGAAALAMQAAAAMKQLFNYAVQAFGGTVAATAALGPEVSIPAGTAVMGTVLGEAASIASAAGGYDVPRDMIAKVHEKEMILPKTLSDRVRNMTDGGAGGDVHLHVHATDAQSVKRLFQNNGGLLASIMKQQLRDFKMA